MSVTKLQLRSIIGKRNEATALLASLIKQLNAVVTVEDADGKVLVGDVGLRIGPNECPIMADNVNLGWVKGDERSELIAAWLGQLAQKESEKKKLGTEVLNLYQEVNLIFDFSEKLAETIGAAEIARVTLDEASRVIISDAGVVVLWDETNMKLEPVASTGELFFDPEKVNTHYQLLGKLVLSGQSEIISNPSSLAGAGIIKPDVLSVVYSALKVKHRVMGALILASHKADRYTAGDLKLLTTLALQSSSAIESALLYEKSIREAKEREEAIRRVYDATAKFVPYEFIDSLGHKVITDVKLGDQVEKIVTVLFSDIREYTTLSERMTPAENFRFVCSFNERMGPVIKKNHGFINQYLGDAIMAIFPGNAADALNAAIEMQKEVEIFNREREINKQSPIRIGVGMHTGSLIMGITGDAERMDATTISDTVNTASRIESLTKHYKGSILISEACLKQFADPGKFHLRHLGLVQLKGKHDAIAIYECFIGNPEHEVKQKLETLAIFNEGMGYYLNRSFEKAHQAFHQVLQSHPNDQVAKLFYSKTKQYIDSGTPENWIGVMEMNEK